MEIIERYKIIYYAYINFVNRQRNKCAPLQVQYDYLLSNGRNPLNKLLLVIEQVQRLECIFELHPANLQALNCIAWKCESFFGSFYWIAKLI